MSANNYITINLKTFEIRERISENTLDNSGEYIGTGNTLEEAISLVQQYQKDNIVEHGIHFV